MQYLSVERVFDERDRLLPRVHTPEHQPADGLPEYSCVNPLQQRRVDPIGRDNKRTQDFLQPLRLPMSRSLLFLRSSEGGTHERQKSQQVVAEGYTETFEKAFPRPRQVFPES